MAVIILSIFITAFMSIVVVGATVPERNGNIQDNAKLFPDEKIKEINLAANQQYNSMISFNILTIKSLDGENSEDFAKEVYNSWNLDENEVLIVLSKEERRIEVNFKNPTFLANINKLPSDYDNDGINNDSKLEEMINKHFIPYAKNDDYSSGVISFMISFHQLNTIDNSSPNGSQSGAPHTSPTEITKNQDLVSRDSVERIIRISILIIVGFVVGVILIQIFSKRKSKKSRLLNLQNVNQELLSNIKQAQEDAKSLSNTFKGSTKIDLYIVAKNLNSLSSKASYILSELDKMQIPFLRLKGFDSTFSEKSKELSEIEPSLAIIKKQVKELKNLEQKILSSNDKLVMILKKIQDEMSKIPKNTDLQRSWSEIQREFETLQNFRIYDLETIDADFKIINSKVEILKAKIDRLPELYQELNNGPQRISNFKNQVHRLLTDNNIKLTEFNPYNNIIEAERVLQLLERSLSEGHFENANKYSEDITRNLRTAVDQVQERISLKKHVENEIQYIEKHNLSISISDDHFNEIYSVLQNLLVDKYWIGLPDKFKEYGLEHQELMIKVQLIKELSSYDVQKYTEANGMLKAITEQISVLESNIENINNSVDFFRNKIQTTQELFKTSSIRLREASEKAMQGELHLKDDRFTLLFERCLNQKDHLEKLIMIKPYDMELIDLELSQYVSNIEEAVNLVEQMLKAINKVERRQVRTRRGPIGYR